MSSDLIFGLVGGLGFFFFGMKTMSDGLKKIAGEKLKKFLDVITRHRILGVVVGAFVTVLIQSSSATTVMIVGFVNAGLLGLRQAIPVIMGANIGTTFTAWLVSFMSVFKISQYALPCVGIGYAVMALAKRKKHQDWGQVILGFGILFIGLSFMKDAFDPLKDSQAVKDIFISFGANPVLGVIVGIVSTILLQSSSATIAIVQVLAFNGVIELNVAIPIILGDNIGTTITAQMAAVGTNINARRAAMSHTIFNVIGVCYMLFFVQTGLFVRFLDFIIPGEISTGNIMFYIAVAHSSFNVINTLVFLPFVDVLKNVSVWLVPQRGESIDFGTKYLEDHLLETPTLALAQVKKENIYMLSVARKAVTNAVEGFFEHDMKKISKASELEDVTDRIQSEITQYIIRISQESLRSDESKVIPVLIHNVNDLERIGDHAQNLSELSKRALNEELQLNPESLDEIRTMYAVILEMFEEAKVALKENNREQAASLLKHEETINALEEKFKHSHVARLNCAEIKLDAEFLFLEFVDNLEKVGDRLTNVAHSVIGKMKWEVEKKSVVKKSSPAV